MCRGNRQNPVFLDSTDCEVFLKTLGDVCKRCGWLVHAYALMGNHYHLLIETPEPNLVDGMRWVQGVYTQRFNGRHKVWGHLFQGRYRALLVDRAGEYFSTVASYIHLNPARARCFDLKHGQLSDYKWSSYVGVLRPSKRPEWLVVNRGLSSVGFDDSDSGRAGYLAAMQKKVMEVLYSEDPAMADEAWAEIRKGWVFGSDEFCVEMKTAIQGAAEGRRRDSYSGGAVKKHDEQAASDWLSAGLLALQMNPSDLALLKKGDDRKKAIAWLIRRNTSVRNEWISQALNMGNVSTVSRGVHSVEAAKEDRLFELKQVMSKIKD
jgi:REP element-mobilizing transposase RayT